jgi:hypothetical protein
VPPHSLGVFAILDLHPRRPAAHEPVGSLLELGDDALKVPLDDLGEEVHPAPMDMRQELQARSSARDDSTQHPLPLDERKAPQVSAIQPKDIERHEKGGTAAVEECVEQRATVAVQADYLTVEDGVAHASERDCDLGRERGEALEGVAVAGDETTPAVLDVGERPEPVELQLEQPVAMVEGLTAAL